MSVRWQHCIDHADKYSKAGTPTRLSSRRSSATDRQSVKTTTVQATPYSKRYSRCRRPHRGHCACTRKFRDQYWLCKRGIILLRSSYESAFEFRVHAIYIIRDSYPVETCPFSRVNCLPVYATIFRQCVTSVLSTL